LGWKEWNKTQGWEEQPRSQCCLRQEVKLAARGSDAAVKHQTQGWARTAQVAMPAKNMPGRKAGEDHARSQCPLRGEAFDGSTLSLAAISGFSAFKRAAAFSVNGFMILNGQR